MAKVKREVPTVQGLKLGDSVKFGNSVYKIVAREPSRGAWVRRIEIESKRGARKWIVAAKAKAA